MSFEHDLRELQRNLDDFQQRYIDGVAVGLMEEGYAMDAVMVPLIPVRTGRTKSSHFVQPPQSAMNPQVVVGVGTSYAPYLRLKGEAPSKPPKLRAPRDTTTSAANVRIKDDNFVKVAFEQRQRGYPQRLGKRVVNAVKSGRSLGAVQATAPKKPE